MLCALQGIATLALESPYYGERKPGYQQGAKLHRVSDLLLLGRATIEESLFLLQWMAQQGHSKLGEPLLLWAGAGRQWPLLRLVVEGLVAMHVP